MDYFQFQLHAYPLFKHRLPIHPISIFHPHHHLNSLHNSFDQQVQPRCLRSYSRSLDLIWKIRQAKMHPQVEKVHSITPVYSMQQCLIMALPISSATLMYPLWFCAYCATSNDITITPIIPTLTISSIFTTPETISLGRGHHRIRRNTLYHVEEQIWPYWSPLNGLHRSWVLNSSWQGLW